MTAPSRSYTNIKIEKVADGLIAQLQLNRPKKMNAMNSVFWKECRDAFEEVGADSNVRVVVVTGAGKHFTSGLDLTDIGVEFTADGGDVARKAFQLKRQVAHMQEAFNAIERIPQPVIAAVHGACIGAGIDMITACDVRLCTADAFFAVKEVQIGLAADVGTLQRLPKLVGNHSLMRELCYTGRNFGSEEAVALGLVSRVLPTQEELYKAANTLAQDIASRSPVAVYGTKVNLNYTRDHSVADGLDYVTTWNMAALQTQDIESSVTAALTKTKPEFSKL